jgi:hypothetical protein
MIESNEWQLRSESLIKLVLGPVSKLFQILFGLFRRFNWLRMVKDTFIVDHILKNILGRFKTVPTPIEALFANWLLLLIMKAVEVRMRKALFNSISLIGVEGQHFR